MFTYTWHPYSQAIISGLTGIYYDIAQVIKNLRDPLALDLNGDGITTLSANEEILFDHNNSGIRYGTGWINASDGWLALDRNGNGQIDSGRELFGDSTRKLNGNLAAHAYDALKSFDTNNDGQVDSADATGDTNTNGMIDGNETYWDISNNGEYDAGVDKVFSDLRVWVDANSNGETDSGAATTDVDTLALLNEITDFREFWFERDDSTETGGDDLIVTPVGKENGGSLRIEDWFSEDPTARLQQMTINEDDGDVYSFLLDSHFDALVQAMSSVTPPASLADLQTSSTYSTVRDSWASLTSPQP